MKQNHSPTASSTAGYRHEIGSLQLPAPRAQEYPAQQRDVVVPADRRVAVGAVRAGLAEAPVVGQARDADVQEAAEEQAKQKCGDLEGEGREHTFEYRLPGGVMMVRAQIIVPGEQHSCAVWVLTTQGWSQWSEPSRWQLSQGRKDSGYA